MPYYGPVSQEAMIRFVLQMSTHLVINDTSILKQKKKREKVFVTKRQLYGKTTASTSQS